MTHFDFISILTSLGFYCEATGAYSKYTIIINKALFEMKSNVWNDEWELKGSKFSAKISMRKIKTKNDVYKFLKHHPQMLIHFRKIKLNSLDLDI